MGLYMQNMNKVKEKNHNIKHFVKISSSRIDWTLKEPLKCSLKLGFSLFVQRGSGGGGGWGECRNSKGRQAGTRKNSFTPREAEVKGANVFSFFLLSNLFSILAYSRVKVARTS